MVERVTILGAGLAGSEAACVLAHLGFAVRLVEMRPVVSTPVHRTADCAELVCSNSLKSMDPDSAAGLLKQELAVLGSFVFSCARRHQIRAGSALALDRAAFSREVTAMVEEMPNITLVREEARDIATYAAGADAVIVASGPLTSTALALSLSGLTGCEHLSFYDAAAPIVMAASLDMDRLFWQSRYGKHTVASASAANASEGATNARECASNASEGDYLNAPFTREEYEAFADELCKAKRVIAKDFESRELFGACRPVEEIARTGRDALRFGTLKPVGLVDPRTGMRPWAVLQLRREDAFGTSYNLVGFQTNLTFAEQRRVFRMIPGLEHAEFARFGVMHRNTFIDAPRSLDAHLRLVTSAARSLDAPVYVAGQLAGTEGYCEAIRSGLHAALSVASDLSGCAWMPPPRETVFGALLHYATDPATKDYQPMHVNFGLLEPLDKRVRNKAARYHAYAERASSALYTYASSLEAAGLLIKRKAGGDL